MRSANSFVCIVVLALAAVVVGAACGDDSAASPCEGSAPCGGHGVCSDSTGEAVCTCDAGYAGDRCEGCEDGYQQSGDSCEATCTDGDGDGYGVGPGCLGADCADDDPGAHPGAVEVCDGTDNDCDGQVDVSSAFENHVDEPNESCGSPTTLSAVVLTADGTVTFSVGEEPTVYPGDDQDFYTMQLREPTDPVPGCLPMLNQECYTLTLALTRPAGGADFELCASTSDCSQQTCTTGDVLVLNWAGVCGFDDSADVFFSVRSAGPGSFDCAPYALSLSAEMAIISSTAQCPAP